MHSNCTVIMYHYVRALKYSRYPNIKGLDVTLFEEQLNYLQKNYQLIKISELIDAIENQVALPPNAALLTFDDAYIDHYTNVFPILEKKKLQGAFYVPVKTVTEHVILDVNKIHFILAAVDDKNEILTKIYSELNNFRDHYKLESNEYYFKKLAIASRFDPKEVVFIKRLLQVELPEELRNIITNRLFQKFVTSDQESFSRELYMSENQVACMQRNGMHIGAHGNDHYWMGSLSKAAQENEINKSIAFIKQIGGSEKSWTMSYPYGSYNQDTLDILRAKSCKLAFTTVVDIASVNSFSHLELPRLDTNDIPCDGNALPNDWWHKSANH